MSHDVDPCRRRPRQALFDRQNVAGTAPPEETRRGGRDRTIVNGARRQRRKCEERRSKQRGSALRGSSLGPDQAQKNDSDEM